MVCHGGNPKEEKEAKIAHTGAPGGNLLSEFVVHAGSVWVNEKTCGECHKELTYAQFRSIMQTEAKKIQGALWGWGPASTGYGKKFDNYDVDNPDGPVPVYGTSAYKDYTQALMKQFPDNFPPSLVQVPATNLDNLKESPWEGYLHLCAHRLSAMSCGSQGP